MTKQRLEQEFLVAVRRQGRNVWLQTTAAALVLTVLTWAATLLTGDGG